MHIFKITLLRNGNRPRLATLASYLEVVTYIKSSSISHAIDVAEDLVKEHKFVDCVVERVDAVEFRTHVKDFTSGL